MSSPTVVPQQEISVVVIDDSETIRRRLAAALTDVPGVRVVAAVGDADVGLAAIREHVPAVVILDLRMPGGGGLGLLERMERRTRPPVVVVLTNYPFPAYRKRCAELGADFFFDKASEFDKAIDVARLATQPHVSGSREGELL